MATKVFLFSWLSIFASSWQPTDLIWNYGINMYCNKGLIENPRVYFEYEPFYKKKLYKNIQKNDLVFVFPDKLRDFIHSILPSVKEPFILIVSGSDATFPYDCISEEDFKTLLKDPNVMHIFAQNCGYIEPNSKVSPQPIGNDFHTCSYKGSGGWGIFATPKEQEQMILECLSNAPPTSKRICKAFVDFHHSDSTFGSYKRHKEIGETRLSIFQTLKRSKAIDYCTWLTRDKLWKKKAQYAFSISPHGNGYDCHRTWEDLSLGMIVIVKSSFLDSLYEGLPVVIIGDWKEVTPENLQKWLDKYGDVSLNQEYRYKLSTKYWLNRILSKRI